MHTRLGKGMKVAQNCSAPHTAAMDSEGEWDKQKSPGDP